jgi:two-component system chemotaxis response regulator CheY
MNILVVDDDNVSRMAIANAVIGLSSQPPLQLENGQRALQALQDGYLADVLITDVRMPEMDGMELLKRVRADSRFAPMPVMMITAFSARDMVAEALQLGVQGFILKPATADAVFRVRNVMERFHGTLIEGLNDAMHRLSILPDRYWTYIETLIQHGRHVLQSLPKNSALVEISLRTIADIRSALNACLGAARTLGARHLEKSLLQLDALLSAPPLAGDPHLVQARHALQLNLHWLQIYVQSNRSNAPRGMG